MTADVHTQKYTNIGIICRHSTVLGVILPQKRYRQGQRLEVRAQQSELCRLSESRQQQLQQERSSGS